MFIRANVDIWAAFIDAGGLDDIILEVKDWLDNSMALYDKCVGEQELGKIQGLREASGDFISLLEDLKERFPEIIEEQQDEEAE